MIYDANLIALIKNTAEFLELVNKGEMDHDPDFKTRRIGDLVSAIHRLQVMPPVVTFHDIQGRERCYEVWYEMPFIVYSRVGDRLVPFETVPVEDELYPYLFWKADGKIWHAQSNMFARIPNKTHWGLFNKGWYEI